jgi:hydrogenase maturation protein HypF
VLRKIGKRRAAAVLAMARTGIRSPRASSCGRLFDAVSFLAGTAPERMEFEAEAAMRFEAAAGGPARGIYPVRISAEGPGRPLEISFAPLVRALVRDLVNGAPVAEVSARFHESLARLVVRVAARARRERGMESVSLAGGVFLNRRLLERTEKLLERAGFRVFRPLAYSPNDESLSLGQMAWALARLKSGGS